MNKITEAYRQSKHFSVPSKLGLATGYQVAEWQDCLLCIRLCCQLTLSPGGEPLPAHWQARIDNLPTGKASLASIARTLKLWRKWVHIGLSAEYVQGFLYEISNNKT